MGVNGGETLDERHGFAVFIDDHKFILCMLRNSLWHHAAVWRMDGEDVTPRNVARHIVFSIFWNFPLIPVQGILYTGCGRENVNFSPKHTGEEQRGLRCSSITKGEDR